MRLISSFVIAISLIIAKIAMTEKIPANVDQEFLIKLKDTTDISNVWIVEFYSVLCGRCLEFAPTYESFSATLSKYHIKKSIGPSQTKQQKQNSISFHSVRFNCVNILNKGTAEEKPEYLEICSKYGVQSFPTIKV